MKPSWQKKENDFILLIIKFDMSIKRNYKKGIFGGYPFREIDSNSEMAKKIGESPFVKEKLERAKESLRRCPIPEDMIQEMRQSKKKKRWFFF
ncbi:MAG TPA: hypothetical protein VHN59_12165 [Chitinophagaceae bacterium]|nr:hypothetical protein [Chitinophagaceae bacterium]